VTTPGSTAFDLDRVSRFRSFGSRSVEDVRLDAMSSRRI